MTTLEQIKELSDSRQVAWKKYQDSWVEEAQKYSMEEPKEIDIIADIILRMIRENYKELPVDFILEELTKLGQAPSLVYDDNGHFAITSDGYSSVACEPQDAVIQVFVIKSQWKPTIREALEHYLFYKDRDDEEWLNTHFPDNNENTDDNFFIPFENQ